MASIALYQKLEEDCEPLKKRLRFAQNVIQSPQLSIPGKGDAIFDWLCKTEGKLVNKNRRDSITDSQDNALSFWTTFGACVSSLHNKGYNVNLHHSTMVVVVKMLSKHLSATDLSQDDRISVLTCVQFVLESPNFLKYFQTNIPEFSVFVGITIKALSELDSSHMEVCLGTVTTISTVLRKKWPVNFLNTFSSLFVDNILLPLTVALKHQGSENKYKLRHTICQCIQQVVFTNTTLLFTKFFEEIYEKINSITKITDLEDKYPVPVKLCKVLRDSKNILDDDSRVILFECIFRAFNYQQKPKQGREWQPDQEFKMVVLLSYFVGFKVKTVKGTVPYSNWDKLFGESSAEVNAVSVEVLHIMVEYLSQHHPELRGDIGTMSFLNWLQMIVASLFPLPTSVSCMKIMKLLSAFSKLNPNIVEPNIRQILSAICSKPLSDEELPEYSNLLSDFLNSFEKLNRIPAFLAEFQKCLMAGLNKQTEDGVSLANSDVWLPFKMMEQLSQSATKLTSHSSIEILKNQFSHLSEHCIGSNQLESANIGSDSRKVFVQCVCGILCALLKGVRLLDYCSSLVVLPKICGLLEQFQEILHSFGLLVMENNDPVKKESILLSLFFNLSYHWGAVALLVELYADNGREDLLKTLGTSLKVSSQKQSINGILTRLHPYLSSSEWKKMYNMAGSSKDENFKESLVKFNLQLLSAIQINDSPDLVISKQLAKHVCHSIVQKLSSEGNSVVIDQSTVFDLTLIAPLLDVIDYKPLSDRLAICFIGNVNEESFTKSVALLKEERSMSFAIMCSVLSSLQRVLMASKRKRNEGSRTLWKTAKTVFGKFDAEEMYKAELLGSGDLSEQLRSMAQHAENAILEIEGQEHLTIDECVLSEILQHLQALRSLPLKYLSERSQAIVFIALLGLGLDCCAVSTSPLQNSILKEIFEKLLCGFYEKGNLRYPQMDGFIDYGALLYGLATVDVNFSVSSQLVELLLSQSVYHAERQSQILKKIALLSKKSQDHIPGKKDLLLGTLLMQELSKETSHLPLKDSALIKARKKISNSFEALIVGQFLRPAEALYPYACTLNLKLVSDENADSLTPYLKRSLKQALIQVKASVIAEQRGAVTLLLVVLKHRSKLTEWVSSSFIKKLWFVLKSMVEPLDTLVTATFSVASEEEMSDIVKDLLCITKQLYTENNADKTLLQEFSPDVMQLWVLMIKSCPKQPDNTYMRSKKGISALCNCLFFLEGLPHLKLLNLLNNLFLSSKIHMVMGMIDKCLIALHTVSFPRDPKQFIAVANSYVSTLFALVVHRTVAIRDLVPNIIQVFLKFIKALGHASKVQIGSALSQDNIQMLAKLALEVEKLFNFINRPESDLKDSFKKVACYMIADILLVFEEIKLYRNVEVHFENMIFILLRLIDTKSITFLRRVLQPALAAIFDIHYQAGESSASLIQQSTP